jgi:hypothetical protein
MPNEQINVDALAQEIRRVDGNHDLGAGALAEALMPFILSAAGNAEPVAWIANCCVCSRVVDTREENEGGDPFGCELDDGRWTCSEPCWSTAVGADAIRHPGGSRP